MTDLYSSMSVKRWHL